MLPTAEIKPANILPIPTPAPANEIVAKPPPINFAPANNRLF